MVVEERPPLEEEKTKAGDQDLRREIFKNLAWIFYFVFFVFFFNSCVVFLCILVKNLLATNPRTQTAIARRKVTIPFT